MYKDQFKQANQKIRMNEELKNKILCEMEEQVEKKNRRRKKLFTRAGRAVAAVTLLTMMVGGITVGAVTEGWIDDIKQFFNGRSQQSNVMNGEVETKSDNFFTDMQLEKLGQKVNIEAKSGEIIAKITGLMSDKYTLYGIVEINGSDDMELESKHKKDELIRFDLDFEVGSFAEINTKTKVMEYSFDAASHTSYQLFNGDEKKLKFAFSYQIDSFMDLEDNGSIAEDNFSGKEISIYGIHSNCECENCNRICSKINEMLEKKRLSFTLPKEFSSCDNDLKLRGTYVIQNYYNAEYEVVNHKAIVENIIITPFSIRFLQKSDEKDWIPNIKINFKDDTDYDGIDISILNSEKRKKGLIYGEFYKPINIKQIKSVKIGDDTIDIN